VITLGHTMARPSSGRHTVVFIASCTYDNPHDRQTVVFIARPINCLIGYLDR